MEIDKFRVFEAVKNYYPDITYTEVTNLLSQVDVNAIINEEKSKVTNVKMVKKGDTICGITIPNHPNEFLRKIYTQLVEQGGVFLYLEYDGRSFLQYDDPFKPGLNPILPENFENTKEAYIEKIIEPTVYEKIVRKIVELKAIQG